MGWVSHLEYFWNAALRALSSDWIDGAAVLSKRGTGLSDPVPISELPTLEQRLDDVRAVMEGGIGAPC
jgi:hypothetical protein